MSYSQNIHKFSTDIEKFPRNKIDYIKPNCVHNYIINSSLAIIERSESTQYSKICTLQCNVPTK
jgi:hypothetical protein